MLLVLSILGGGYASAIEGIQSAEAGKKFNSECSVFSGESLNPELSGYENCMEKGYYDFCAIHRVISERWYLHLGCYSGFEFENTFSSSLACVNKPSNGNHSVCISPLEVFNGIPQRSKYQAYSDELVCCREEKAEPIESTAAVGSITYTGNAVKGGEGGTGSGLSQGLSYMPECMQNSDCSDGNACTFDMCYPETGECSNIEINTGCSHEGKCLPIGVRAENKYCSMDKTMVRQLAGEDESCTNSYQCASNICVNNACIGPSMIQKVMDWFSSLV